jgi:hypothetical protein
MAKPKFSLTPSPTFKAKVDIPIPGGAPAQVEFVFKGRTRDQFESFMNDLSDKKPDDLVMDIASGWDLDEAFEQDNIDKLTQNYLGAGLAIWAKYVSELTKARQGN